MTLITSTPTSNPRQIRHSFISNPAGTTYSPLPAEQDLRTTSASSVASTGTRSALDTVSKLVVNGSVKVKNHKCLTLKYS
ncbi:hypothetical protein I315_06332 [Cryptococcus gattii Ru294]|nr:hypothetical protein I315_06332 [Cryptococcus gattii Ru294]